jgi:hypothetical protein
VWINTWLEDRRISGETLCRRIDGDTWVKLSEIKRFSNFLSKLASLPPREVVKDSWENDPATKEQLKRLAFFDLPFPETNLPQGEASELIEFFANVDPKRQEQYQNQPGAEEKRTTRWERLIRMPSGERLGYLITAGFSYGEASDGVCEIEQLEIQKADLAAELAEELESKKFDYEAELMCIDNHYNGDSRELYGYKKLTRKHLERLHEYCVANDYAWSSKSFEVDAALVLALFPELKRAEKTHAPHGSKHAPGRKAVQSSKGCLLLMVPLVGILLYAMKGILLQIG